MKRHINIMGFLLSIGLFCISQPGFSQDKKLDRQERKEARKAEIAANFDTLNAMLESRNFVLKANNLESKYGDVVQVSSNTNFILVHSSSGILQTAFNSMNGNNGLGGVTAEGEVGSWELFKNQKNMTFTVKFSLVTNIGIYDVLMTVNSDKKAHAEISGLAPGRLTYNGYLASVSDSGIFKGRNSL
jgi:hypothetical protein